MAGPPAEAPDRSPLLPSYHGMERGAPNGQPSEVELASVVFFRGVLPLVKILAEQTGNTDAWAKMMQMPQAMLPAGYAEQIQKMQEQMRQQTEQMMGMFGLKR